MCIALLALKISRKKLVRVYNAHGLLKKIVVGNVRIKYQSYIIYDTFTLAHIDLSARLLINLHMARYGQTYIFSLFSYLSKVNIQVQNKSALDSFNSSIIKT